MTGSPDQSGRIQLIAVGVDGEQGCDAVAQATAIARATGAELMLVTVQSALPGAVVEKIGRAEADAKALLQDLAGSVAPRVRTLIETGSSVRGALARVVRREHPDVLVLGSSGGGPAGRVRIGRCTRQLLGDADCAIAVVPRGLCSHGQQRLAVIGVGYDGTREAGAALREAGRLARQAGARLRVRAVLDDRLPYPGPRWAMPVGGPELQGVWDQVIQPKVDSLRKDAERAATATGAEVEVETSTGSPSQELIAFSQEVELLVIGSRRWGAAARLLLGTTGEELMHQACCSVMAAPPPSRGVLVSGR